MKRVKYSIICLAFLTLDAKVGWADNSSSPFASILKHPEVGIGFQFCVGKRF